MTLRRDLFFCSQIKILSCSRRDCPKQEPNLFPSLWSKKFTIPGGGGGLSLTELYGCQTRASDRARLTRRLPCSECVFPNGARWDKERNGRGYRLRRESRPDSWIARLPWRDFSSKSFVNGKLKEGLPISPEITAANGCYSTGDRRRPAERANMLLGHKAGAKEQLFPLEKLLYPFFINSSTLIRSFFFSYGMSGSLLTLWLIVSSAPSLNCNSSTLVMMGTALLSRCTISGHSKMPCTHDTISRMCGDSFTQVGLSFFPSYKRETSSASNKETAAGFPAVSWSWTGLKECEGKTWR